MNQIFQLIRKDFIIDWRRQEPFTGILLYLAATVFTTYMAFRGFVSVEVWNALFWIILLFTGINAISKSFIQEESRTHYFFFTCKSSHLIVAKLIYSCLYLQGVAFLAIAVFSILFGNPIPNYLLFTFNTFSGVLGISSAFTMVSAIAFRASNRPIMMAVLGFPVVVPVLILSINNSYRILDGFIWLQIRGNVFALLSVDVIIIALTYILFPFTWKS
ncbi:MAG: heme exporter protein CcmB [Ekhidna sp.]|nr:heme exporter protein CcmB [Ekhidna sp.]